MNSKKKKQRPRLNSKCFLQMEEPRQYLGKELPDNEPAMLRLLHYCQFDEIKSLRGTCRRLKEFIDTTRKAWPEDISALHLAARYDNLSMAVDCISHGFRLDQKIERWRVGHRVGFPMQILHRATPLHVAAYYSSNEVLRALLEAGADKDAESSCCGSVIQTTIEVDNKDGFLLLMAAEAKLEGAVMTCARLGRSQFAEYLLDRMDAMRPQARSELEWSLNSADPEESPLYVACRNGFYTLAKILLAKGLPTVYTDILGTTVTPLVGACQNGHLSVATLLMDAGVSPDPPAPTYALSTRDPVDLTFRFQQSSPLFIAFKKEDAEMFRLLIRRGARVSLTPHTPRFHQGMLHGMLNELRYFSNMERGLDMIWEALRTRRFDINAKDPRGDTALHTFANICSTHRFWSKHLHFINLLDMLLQHGADKTIKNAQGKTPFDIFFSSDGTYEFGVSNLHYELNSTGFLHFLKTVYRMLL